MEVSLDVSMLEPCEPLDRTLESVEQLKEGDYLLVIHRKEPLLLYPLLVQRGFCYRLRKGGPSVYQVLIWREQDAAAEAAVNKRLAGN
ncbi:DUF2249 domain-containing protein [endosymbiont of Ridgeia piscesae]|jgi:uncharacterized protein (DUF2249 family)|uniref:Uncharacterized conserved protein, DUF2249 family n=1 Tax=endosymbiont of Ridgeia piscesae TaxID=54398 RepID=A0A0T5YWV4_9GAMM|nr:DUF2249 domain-containing protein [endosymbiont of Ridgeia piscesae]KRT55079.1 hypothetical protein Ga0074115_11351 [endosymbiont of Ridgeia piscesae]KRT58643.1 Uncharacterized conserved protein, DUF2249 family [endosymbiont of Ridgeia piscesae]